MKKITWLFCMVFPTIQSFSQNVGINTAAPLFPLTVVTNGQGVTQISNDGTTRVGFWTSNGAAYVQTGSNHPLYFTTNNGNIQMTLSTQGTVGIGNSLPDDAGLVVDKKIGATNAMFGRNTSGIAIESNFPGIGLNSYYNAGRKVMSTGYSGLIGFNPVSGDLSLYTSPTSALTDAASTAATRLLIDKDGNIGVEGNTNPVAPFSFANLVGNKISLYGSSATSHYGLGIQGSLLQMYSSGSTADIAFGYGSSSAFTETMRIRGNGNVGIGTSTPSAKLDIDQNSSGAAIEVNQLGSGLAGYLYSAGNNAVYALTGSATNAAGHFQGTNALIAMGKVGINTSTPETVLTVNSSGLGFMHTDGTVKIATEILAGEGAFGTNTAHGLRFRTGGTTKMYISAAGNVGIGTFTPAEKLDIIGQIKITDGTQAAGKVLQSDATGAASWQDVANPKLAFNLNCFGGSTITNGSTIKLIYSDPLSFQGEFEEADCVDNANGYFNVTVSGVYHFIGEVTYLWGSLGTGNHTSTIAIRRKVGATIYTLNQETNPQFDVIPIPQRVEGYFKLVAGDQVFLELNVISDRDIAYHGTFFGARVY